jgi:hypothetical protein
MNGLAPKAPLKSVIGINVLDPGGPVTLKGNDAVADVTDSIVDPLLFVTATATVPFTCNSRVTVFNVPRFELNRLNPMF